MILHMPYWEERQAITVPDTSTARIAKYHGGQVIVIDDRYYMTYSEFSFRQFVRKVAEYHDFTEIEGEISYTDKMTPEALLAYAYYRKYEWVDTEERINRMKVDIENLCLLTKKIENAL